MRFEFSPTEDGPDLAAAEALQSIAHDVNRIADAMEGDDGPAFCPQCGGVHSDSSIEDEMEHAEIDAEELVAELEEDDPDA